MPLQSGGGIITQGIRPLKTVLKLLLAAAVIAVALTAWQAGRALPMGAGYIAKTMCSEHFVAGRPDPGRIWPDIRELSPLFAFGRYELDAEAQQVTGYLGPGLLRTTAVYREGLGCTLAAGVPAERLRGMALQDAAAPIPSSWRRAAPRPALEAALDEAFAEPGPDTHRHTRAVVVLHGGVIAAERYAPGFGPDTPLIGWSMTKSVTNNLIGLLVDDGLLDPDQPAPVPEWQQPGDPRRDIRLRDLLQMSSGLDFEEAYEPGSDATNMLFTEFSAAGYAAAAPLAHAPGSHWYYSSGSTNILARIVRDTVGGSLEDVYAFARKRLFAPLGISSMIIEPDASGSPVGSSFGYATARDWARLGQFWLQDGVWAGQRLLPEGWMEWSVTPAPATPRGEYGAQFWLNAGVDGEHRSYPRLPPSMYLAHGFNGQMVTVFPEQDVVVARLGLTTDDSWDEEAFLVAVLAALE
jgi:CubicO group peptidase (beta-lactamase class C family)